MLEIRHSRGVNFVGSEVRAVFVTLILLKGILTFLASRPDPPGTIPLFLRQ